MHSSVAEGAIAQNRKENEAGDPRVRLQGGRKSTLESLARCRAHRISRRPEFMGRVANELQVGLLRRRGAGGKLEAVTDV